MTLDTTKTRVAGVDISLDDTTFAIVDVRGNILAKDSFPTSDYPNVNDFVSHLSECIIALVETNGGYENMRSVGISTPSGNFLTGCIEYSPDMPWKGEVPLAAMLRDRLGIAVAVANSAHVRALGEATYGCAHGMRDFVVVAVGHTIGSSFFSNGHVHLGTNGYAGELGHVCIVDGGRQCKCGARGCLEAYCAHDGIITTARHLMERTDTPSAMRDIPIAELTPLRIQELCEEGDELAIAVYRKTGHMLGVGLANYASLLNPEAIILTGGIVRTGKWLIEPAFNAFEEHIFRNTQHRIRFLTSTLSEVERDVLGASALAWNVKEYSLFK